MWSLRLKDVSSNKSKMWCCRALKIFKHHTWPPSKLTWWLFGWSTKSYKASQLYLMVRRTLGCREKAEIILGNRQPQGPLNGDQSEAINDFGFFKQAHTSKQPDDERPDLSSDANLWRLNAIARCCLLTTAQLNLIFYLCLTHQVTLYFILIFCVDGVYDKLMIAAYCP